MGKKMIYFSTYFIFNGKKENECTEKDASNPINWYANEVKWRKKL